MRKQIDDQDSPWKEILERFFVEFIDWIMVLPRELEQQLKIVLFI